MRTLLRPATGRPALTDIALLITRVALGVILVAHGWQKYHEWTIAGTAGAFEGMGIPAPTAAAVFATIVEMVGGTLLILGLLTPVVAVLNGLNLLGALVLVHISNGVFVGENGFELVLALIAGLLVLAIHGGGKYGLDALIVRKKAALA
ncbi:DoxX family protein [Cumulibacter manganitolerans]|uniref:DoxX family protein n=1 Tax=Cumulibacter manganitolerans TaxID=1884992 RepID=UPI001294B90E|nr:DoxX family protein [Cumulibacter manganitolerans]